MILRFILMLMVSVFLFFTAVFAQSSGEHFEGDYFQTLRFAHRGGYANGPENTIHTILGSIEKGNYAIEIDVQLTRDGQLVLFHDEYIGRILETERAAKVSDLTLEEFVKIPMRDESHGLQFPCSLEQLMDTMAHQITVKPSDDFIFEIDFKPHGEETKRAVDALMAIVEKGKRTLVSDLTDHFFVSTFYPEVLKEIHDRGTSVRTAFAVTSTSTQSRLKAKLAVLLAPLFIRKYDVTIFEPNICLINKRYVRKWQRKGVLINTYTANSECEKKYLEQFPIAYTTNCPSDVSCPGDPSDEPGKPVRWCKACRDK